MKSTPLPEELIFPEANQIFFDETSIEISIRIDRALRKIISQSYEQGKRDGKQKMLIKVVQWMNKQGYEELQEEFVNALTKEENV